MCCHSHARDMVQKYKTSPAGRGRRVAPGEGQRFDRHSFKILTLPSPARGRGFDFDATPMLGSELMKATHSLT